jgi:hypothetical protein
MRLADLDLHDGSGGLRLRRTRRRAHSGDGVLRNCRNKWRSARRLCPPARLPSPGEQLLWRSAMSTRDLRDDRIGSQRPSTASAFSPSTTGADHQLQ